ncbi:MAG: aminopeptidase, partial [Gammaproteobacteria bacterium]
DLGRAYAVWNVVAAPEFSLEPVQSCFPVAGCVSYRGFYAREDAERHAARLRAEGHDVFVGGVPAYSTLGWFDDPLLSTFIGYPEAELARLVFHELAHQVLYVKGDTSFNESFAVAVEREGVRRWLLARGNDAEVAAFAAAQARAAEFAGLMADARGRLEALYAEDLPPQEKRARKAAALRALAADYAALKRERWNGFSGYDRYFAAAGPNNALLASFATYTQHVDAFARLLAAEGGDLERFYARVRQIAALDKAIRDALLAGN